MIKSYVLRAGRMTDTQKENYASLASQWCIEPAVVTETNALHAETANTSAKVELDYECVFSNSHPVVIEIGFGMGKATSLIAQEHPHINYIGIEVHKPGVGKLLGEIETHDLHNVRIIEYDAVSVLTHMIRDNSVSGFHIFFPDPWPKKRHHKRRLIQRPFTDMLARKLCASGYVYMATDWEDYAQTALAALSDTPLLHNAYEGFAPHQAWRPETRFEEKGIAASHQIFELFFTHTV